MQVCLRNTSFAVYSSVLRCDAVCVAVCCGVCCSGILVRCQRIRACVRVCVRACNERDTTPGSQDSIFYKLYFYTRYI